MQIEEVCTLSQTLFSLRSDQGFEVGIFLYCFARYSAAFMQTLIWSVRTVTLLFKSLSKMSHAREPSNYCGALLDCGL